MAEDQTEPLLRQAQSFYFRSSQLTEAMDGYKQKASELELEAGPTPTEEEEIEIEWQLHKADSSRRAAIKFLKRGDKLMKRWEKYQPSR